MNLINRRKPSQGNDDHQHNLRGRPRNKTLYNYTFYPAICFFMPTHLHVKKMPSSYYTTTVLYKPSYLSDSTYIHPGLQINLSFASHKVLRQPTQSIRTSSNTRQLRRTHASSMRSSTPHTAILAVVSGTILVLLRSETLRWCKVESGEGG